MRKMLFFILLTALSVTTSYGQTTATNFTASDCNSTSHTLFTELDAGKIVVLVWVMPCGACISDAKAAYDAVQGFAASHPGKVLYWIADDFGNTSCATLSSWASTNAIGPASATAVFFGNSGVAIDENNFGGTGMPHVVVMGGTDHRIYYNKLNGSNDGAAITSAIQYGISVTSSVPQVGNDPNKLLLFPNPAKDKISVSYTLVEGSNVNLEIFDVLGNKIVSTKLPAQPAGQHTFDVRLDNRFSNGLYFMTLSDGSRSQTVKFTVNN